MVRTEKYLFHYLPAGKEKGVFSTTSDLSSIDSCLYALLLTRMFLDREEPRLAKRWDGPAILKVARR